MKSKPCCLCFITFVFLHVQLIAQTNTFPSTGAAGIGTISPDASSLLEIKSTTQGILISRMTKSQRDAITTPATGLMIYQTNSTPGFYYFDGGSWKAVTPAGVNKNLSNLSTTSVNQSLLPDSSATRDLGSSSLLWKDAHFSGSIFLDTTKFLDNAGFRNTFIGATQNTVITTGQDNTFTGVFSGFSNTKGSYNAFYGSTAGFANTTGNENSFFGALAGNGDSTGSQNSFFGQQAGFDCSGNNNSFFGNGAGGSFGNTAGNNSFFGNAAGIETRTGTKNTFLGNLTGRINQTGSNNTLIGDSATVGTTNLFNATALGADAIVSANNSLVLGSIANLNNATTTVNVGIGTSSPQRRLHVVLNGASGGIGNTNAGIFLENNNSAYMHILTPNANENGLIFGTVATSTNGAIIFNNSTVRNGLEIRTGGNQNRIIIDSAGRVAIGNFVASHRLQLNTDDAAKPGTGTWTIASDRKLKTNLSSFNDGLKIVNQVNPVWFEYNGKAGLPTGKKFVGIIAQDMQKIAPYMVGTFTQTDSTGKKTEYLDYNPNSLFYILVNSVKELSAINDEQKSEIQSMRSEIDELKTMMQTLQQNFSSCNVSAQQPAMSNQSPLIIGASLQQNIPNPFTHATIINYNLPQQYSSAQIIITDKDGKILKAINLSAKGKGNINVDASTLSAGVYQYSLYVNSKLIDTKQMVLLQ